MKVKIEKEDYKEWIMYNLHFEYLSVEENNDYFIIEYEVVIFEDDYRSKYFINNTLVEYIIEAGEYHPFENFEIIENNGEEEQ